jgi:copper resistance protein B
MGLRLGYDLIDRSFTPYIGVHYERLFGQTADYARDDGEERDALFFVIGARLLF